MTTTTKTTETKTLPYKREPIDIYELIDFAPDEPEPLPDAMLQNRIINRQILSVLDDHLSDSGRNPDVFVDSNAILCYDRSNLNVRIQPDFYAAFGVDAQAILDRELYLPWEVGKPPDFAMEVASRTTARHDVTAKMEIYRRIGIPELWQFDHTGGDFYGHPLAGWRLADGVYLPIETTARPDGFISGYSPATKLFICWDDGELRFFDPVENQYLTKTPDAHRDSRALKSERTEHGETRQALESQRRETESERTEHDETRQALESQRRETESERTEHGETRQALVRNQEALESERTEHDETRRALESQRRETESERTEHDETRQALESQRRETESERTEHGETRRALERERQARERESERARRLEEELRRLRGEE